MNRGTDRIFVFCFTTSNRTFYIIIIVNLKPYTRSQQQYQQQQRRRKIMYAHCGAVSVLLFLSH